MLLMEVKCKFKHLGKFKQQKIGETWHKTIFCSLPVFYNYK